MKEVKLGRYAGPFKKVPFKHYIQSLIGLVAKDNGKDTRLIFHLSYPRKPKSGNAESVNGNTPPNYCKVQYPDFNEAIDICLREGRFCHISRSDMRSAFRNLGISKKYWKYLVMKARDPKSGKWYYFFDKALPLGASVSCKIFQDFSDSVARIVQSRIGPGKNLLNYLDDYLFAALLQHICNQRMQIFLNVCQEINFPVSPEKTFPASTQLTLLGFLIDMIKQIVCIPCEKISKARNMINFVLSKKKLTVHQLQKICGFLNFLGRCVVPGQAFTRRLYSKPSNKNFKKYHHINITTDMREDLNTWLNFINHPSIFLSTLHGLHKQPNFNRC